MVALTCRRSASYGACGIFRFSRNISTVDGAAPFGISAAIARLNSTWLFRRSVSSLAAAKASNTPQHTTATSTINPHATQFFITSPDQHCACLHRVEALGPTGVGVIAGVSQVHEAEFCVS